MSSPNTTYIKKFSKQLGDLGDFVDYVKKVEKSGKLSDLAGFVGANGTHLGKRYMLLQKGRVIDFRHFFAAMMQRIDGSLSKPILGVGATNVGDTLMLGLMNELKQCMGELSAGKLNSCFSKEDMHSNRLGAKFGELVVIRRAEASKASVSSLLESYLKQLKPLPSNQVKKMQLQSTGEVVLEAVGSVMRSLMDAAIPSAY